MNRPFVFISHISHLLALVLLGLGVCPAAAQSLVARGHYRVIAAQGAPAPEGDAVFGRLGVDSINASNDASWL